MNGREIAPGVFWLGGCFEATMLTRPIHYHVSAFLIIGSHKSVLYDTGDPHHWPSIAPVLTRLLAGRPLDYLFPSHPEIPHAGNLAALLERYPAATVVGDIRDYHVHYPEYTERLVALRHHERLDLGDRVLEVIPAYIHDLPNTLWAYDTGSGALFVSDGFSYVHHLPTPADEASHLPGQCWLLSSELPEPPSVEQAAYGTGRALYWTRFVDVSETFNHIGELLVQRSTRLIAPAHGNVISDVEPMIKISLAAHREVYAASASAGVDRAG
jgi:hypothetical protein